MITILNVMQKAFIPNDTKFEGISHYNKHFKRILPLNASNKCIALVEVISFHHFICLNGKTA